MQIKPTYRRQTFRLPESNKSHGLIWRQLNDLKDFYIDHIHLQGLNPYIMSSLNYNRAYECVGGKYGCVGKIVGGMWKRNVLRFYYGCTSNLN